MVRGIINGYLHSRGTGAFRAGNKKFILRDYLQKAISLTGAGGLRHPTWLTFLAVREIKVTVPP
jgi:hypothetical protein